VNPFRRKPDNKVPVFDRLPQETQDKIEGDLILIAQRIKSWGKLDVNGLGSEIGKEISGILRSTGFKLMSLMAKMGDDQGDDMLNALREAVKGQFLNRTVDAIIRTFKS
jgi:hypothetical protein